MSNGRDENGRFTPGNPGGPGRPRRAIEAEYLAALSEVVTLDTWREIVTTAVERAKSGDARAREWIARYVLGSESTVLLNLAASELAEYTPETRIAERAEQYRLIQAIAGVQPQSE